ncbi:MAG: transposase [Sedimentisphaerales bacterium]|nr:transposase [Sedimentisphaerales bacterium]
MSRPIRIEFEDAAYHVTARGNEQRPIFRDDADRANLLKTLAQMCDQFGVVTHVYCLMPNHYHLVIQTPRANLSQAMGWLQTTYTVRFNHRHQRSGHLFQGRFKAHLIDADTYARRLVQYIHLNPVRPRDKTSPIPTGRHDELRTFAWSSHRAYAGYLSPRQRLPWLCLDWLWYFGRTPQEAHRQYRRQVARCFGCRLDNPFAEVRGGLVLGNENLWTRAKEIVARSSGQQEICWKRHARRTELSLAVERLLTDEPDRRVQVWLRVRLAGERMVDVARSLGYANGSAVHQVVRRLEAQQRRDADLARKLHRLADTVRGVKS